MTSASFQNYYRNGICDAYDNASKSKSFIFKKLTKKMKVQPPQPSVPPERGD